MNWGKAIALSFVLFAGFIIYLVIRSFQQDFYLVTEDYYLEEVNYQNRIEEKKNLKRLTEELTISHSEEYVQIEFPTEKASGTIAFYRPNNAHLDQNFEIELTKGSFQKIDKDKLLKGRYKVKVNWTDGSNDFFGEQNIFIQ